MIFEISLAHLAQRKRRFRFNQRMGTDGHKPPSKFVHHSGRSERPTASRIPRAAHAFA